MSKPKEGCGECTSVQRVLSFFHHYVHERDSEERKRWPQIIPERFFSARNHSLRFGWWECLEDRGRLVRQEEGGRFAGVMPPAGVRGQVPRPRGDLTPPASWAVHPGGKVGCSYMKENRRYSLSIWGTFFWLPSFFLVKKGARSYISWEWNGGKEVLEDWGERKEGNIYLGKMGVNRPEKSCCAHKHQRPTCGLLKRPVNRNLFFWWNTGQNNENGSLLHMVHKINLKCNKDLNIRPDMIKLLEKI